MMFVPPFYMFWIVSILENSILSIICVSVQNKHLHYTETIEHSRLSYISKTSVVNVGFSS